MNNTINCIEDLKLFRIIPEGTNFIENGEEWKNVPYKQYADRYLISDDGNTYGIYNHRIMSNHPNDKGYYSANLCKDYDLQRKSISRMVALSFIEDIPENWEELDVNHLDEDPSNNSVENLQWCEHQANCNYGHHNERIAAANRGRRMSDEQRQFLSELHKGVGSKPVVQLDLEEHEVSHFSSITDAAQETGIDPGNISAVCNNRRHTAGGYRWKFA